MKTQPPIALNGPNNQLFNYSAPPYTYICSHVPYTPFPQVMHVNMELETEIRNSDNIALNKELNQWIKQIFDRCFQVILPYCMP